MGLIRRETFVPQSYAWGSESQVDWCEAYADLGGERQKLQVFSLRSMATVGGDSRSLETALQGSVKGELKGLVWLLTHSGYTAVSVFSTL